MSDRLNHGKAMELRHGGEHTPRKRIIAPGAFSSMMYSSYDPEKSANNSNLTVFKILNPGVNLNTPKVDPTCPTLAARSQKLTSLGGDSDSVLTSSTTSSNGKFHDPPLWNPCNRVPKTFGAPSPLKELSKRPTSARSEQLATDSVSLHSSENGGRAGRKLLIELEEELIAKTLQLQQAKRISSVIRQRSIMKKEKLNQRLLELDSHKREMLSVVIATRQSLEQVHLAQSPKPS